MISLKSIKYFIVSIFAILFVLLINSNAFANVKENIFSFQNCLEVELAKQVEDFVISNENFDCDFSSQKSYIRLGEVECVGKVARVAAKGGGVSWNKSGKGA